MPRWLSWLNTSVSKQSKHISIKHTIYQACKDKHKRSMQDINKEIERESNHKHKGFVSRFEHPYSTSPPSTHEEFPLCLIPMDHSSVPQHLQALELPSPVHNASPTSSPRPHLKPRVHTRTLNNANTLVRLLKVQEKISW